MMYLSFSCFYFPTTASDALIGFYSFRKDAIVNTRRNYRDCAQTLGFDLDIGSVNPEFVYSMRSWNLYEMIRHVHVECDIVDLSF